MYVVAEEECDAADNGGAIVILNSSWLTPKKGESYWPRYKLNSQFNRCLQKGESAQENWSIIKLKRRFFETDDLILTRKKAIEAEANRELSEENYSIRRRRKIIPPRKIYDIISSSTDDEICDSLPKQKETTIPKFPLTSLETPDVHSFSGEQNNELLNRNEGISTTLPASLDSVEIPLGSTIDIIAQNNDYLEANQVEQIIGKEYVIFNQDKELEILNDKLDTLLRVTTNIRLDLKDLSQRVDRIKSSACDGASGPTDRVRNVLPLKTIQEIHEFEHSLKDPSFCIEFKTWIAKIGGDSPKDFVKKVLERVFTNVLAKGCSWKGKRNNFPVENLISIRIIKETIIDKSHLTEKEFKDLQIG